ncbi:MAG: polysaccharide biosynthesis/export family protein [Phycisphaerales bacterium]|nr:polysaccharide biosynthesis/export family protein [Phycisphaerales bacterium]
MRNAKTKLCLAFPTLLAAIALAGCDDTRITVQQLREREWEFEHQRTLATTTQPADAAAAALTLADTQPLRVGPRDVLNITLTGVTNPYIDTELKARVHDNGTIRLPQVGSIPVNGLSLTEVEEAIHRAHVPNISKDLTVHVEVTAPEPVTVFVVGSNGQRGIVRLANNQRNVIYALAQSNAYGAAASGMVRVRPAAGGADEVVYNLGDQNDIRRALQSPPLRSGDTIVIETAPPSTIYLTGLVLAPGPQPIPRDSKLTLMRAISSAGGLVDFLEPDEVTLWRVLPDGGQVRAKVNLTDVLSGKEEDIVLAAGDIVDVPHTVKTRVRAWIAQNVRIGPFGVTAVYDPVQEYRFRRALEDQNNNSGFGQSILDTVRFGLPNAVVPPVVLSP